MPLSKKWLYLVTDEKDTIDPEVTSASVTAYVNGVSNNLKMADSEPSEYNIMTSTDNKLYVNFSLYDQHSGPATQRYQYAGADKLGNVLFHVVHENTP